MYEQLRSDNPEDQQMGLHNLFDTAMTYVEGGSDNSVKIIISGFFMNVKILLLDKKIL